MLSLRNSEWPKILGWPGYRVYQHEVDERAKALKLWVRRKSGNRRLICSGCGQRVSEIHEVYEREVRDLACFEFRTTVAIELYRIRCPECGIKTVRVEQLPSKAPFSKRFEEMVGQACESESPGHLPRRCAFARLPHHLFESIAEGSLARQLFYSLGLDPTVRTPNPIQLDRHGRPEFEACQIPYFSLVDFMDLAHPLSASGTDQPPVPGFPPHPQLQCLGLLVNLVLVHPIPRPSQNLRPLAVSQAQQCSSEDPAFKIPINRLLRRFPAEILFSTGS